MTAPRRLVVMRHAKAEPYSATDFERQLTGRGRGDAAAAGRHLAAAGIVPVHAMVSSAVRARQTWEQVRGALAEAADVDAVTEDISQAMYAASYDTVLEALRRLPPETGTAIFVGHNPTAVQLVQLLDDGEADLEVMDAFLAGFPTAAVAVLEPHGEWSELAEGGARLTAFHVGRS